MSTLTGSEKQAQWAEEIRARRLEHYRQYIDDLTSGKLCTPIAIQGDPEAVTAYLAERGIDPAALRAALGASLKLVEGITSAKWWIDNQRQSLRDHICEQRQHSNPRVAAIGQAASAAEVALAYTEQGA